MKKNTRSAMAMAVAVLTALGGLAITSAPAQAAQDKVVSGSPDQNQPRIMNGRVYGIDSAGPLVVVAGSFDRVRPATGGIDQTRQWLFMFNQNTGQIVSTFNPQLTGPAPVTTGLVVDQPGVQSVAFAADGQSVYVAGDFTQAGGQSAQRIARLDLNGNLIGSFKASASETVNDIALVGNRLIVAGRFARLNDQPVSRMGAINATTGATDTTFNIQATQSRYEFSPYVQEIDASPDGKWLAVIGNFERLGGKERNQVGLINLNGTPSVANWYTDAFAGDCASVYDDSWLRGVDISPDSTFMALSGTGAYRGSESLCDSIVRMELPSSPTFTGGNVQPTWRDLTGGDTLWANEITESAIYVGGHQRWHNNPNPSPGGDSDGPGSVERFGFAAIDPASGVPLSLNPGRDRGRGAESLHVSGQRLYVGSDTDFWGGEVRQRIAALSTTGGVTNPKPQAIDLPVDLYLNIGSDIRKVRFDGTTFGTPTTISGPSADGINWGSLLGGFVQNGKFNYFQNQRFFARPFNGSTFGAETNLSNSVGYVDYNADITLDDQPLGVSETQRAAYLNGRIYYTKSGDSNLWSRGYSLESGIIGAHQRVESTRAWGNARGLSFIGDWLYATWSDGKLYRFYAPNGVVDYDSRQVVDNGTNGINWSQIGGFFSTQAAGAANPPAAPNQQCSGSTPWRAEYFNNPTLIGSPAQVACRANVVENWGSSAPSGGNLGADRFSIRWTRNVSLSQQRSIKVDAVADDGVRAFVDGALVLNGWSSNETTGTSEPLSAGNHKVTIEYFENTGNASINASYTAVAPVSSPTADNLPGDTTITSPNANQVFNPASTTVNIAGGATDNVAVTNVRLSVLDRNATTNKWLQPNGSFGPSFATVPVTLGGSGQQSTTWTRSVQLPEGTYAVIARTEDAAGNIDESDAYREFSVSNTVADTQAPAAAVASPTAGQEFTTSSVGASGTATDNVGVTRVRVAVLNRDTPSTPWLQANGTFGAQYAERTATLSNAGGTSTNWSISGISLPDGRYAFDVRSKDAAGNESVPSQYREFTVNTVPADTQSPTATLSSPTKNQVFTTSSVGASGAAADNVGVTRVRVAVINRDTPSAPWLQANGTFGSQYAERTATLSNAGGASTNWAISGISLPDGNYAFDVRSRDAAGNQSDPSQYREFSVDTTPVDNQAPTASVSTPASNSQQTSNPIQFTGSASDNFGVTQVRVAMYNRDDPNKRWLQQNGTWSTNYYAFSATLANPGATNTQWSISLSLPTGSYGADVKGVDAKGNISPSDFRTFTVLVPDSAAPSTALRAAPSGTTKRRATTIRGTAGDNQAISRVEVQVMDKKVKKVKRNGKVVKRKVVKRYLQANGKWGKKRRFVRADLAAFLSRSTAWDLRFKLPTNRRFTVIVRAVDVNGNVDRSPAKTKFRTKKKR